MGQDVQKMVRVFVVMPRIRGEGSLKDAIIVSDNRLFEAISQSIDDRRVVEPVLRAWCLVLGSRSRCAPPVMKKR